MTQFSLTSHAKPEDWIAWGVTVGVLGLALKMHLIAGLFGGLAVYCLVDLITSRLSATTLTGHVRRTVAVAVVATVVLAGVVGIGAGITVFLRGSDESIPALFQRMAEIMEDSRGQLPEWILSTLPDNANDLRSELINWLREHSRSVQTASADALRSMAHLLIGMVIGAMLALKPMANCPNKPFSHALGRHSARYADAFRRVVFAQVWISAINTTLTAAYLALFLPAIGIHLPLTKTLIALTFIVGLMPILGNLISNTVIFIVSLSQSLTLAVGSLLYLVLIHKLEYFLNARIIGSHISARAWELLLVMLIMEAMFGIPGLLIAPMTYAYFKDEFRAKGLI